MLINENAIKVLIARSRKPIYNELARKLNLRDPQAHYMDNIMEVFAKEVMFKNFDIGPYQVDLFFPEHKLVVECHDAYFKTKDPQFMKNREKQIKKWLNCKFKTYKVCSFDFSIFKEIREINEIIFQQ